MKFFIFTLGCQMNLSDSQRITLILESQGHKASSEKDADLVVINACSVRQKAVDRIWGQIKKWRGKKKIVITGCVLPADKKKLKERGIEYKNFNLESFSTFPLTPSPCTLITIMTGCDNFCSYCAVPYTRGREKSRAPKSILSDIERVLKNGAKDILLLGQNVNSYRYGFAELLKKIDSLPGDFRFNFMSSNPHDMTPEIIKTFARLKKWPRELHLPLQSGDDKILKKMNRKYSSQQYFDLVSALRSQLSDLVLTTDIIVGFPGETKSQFNNTVKVCKKIGFKKAFIGQYSPRPGTLSAKLPDDVSQLEKKRRWEILDRLINKKGSHR